MKRTSKPARVPTYRLHRAWGLAVVRLNGKDIYLGKHGSPESKTEYRRVIAEWLAAGEASQPSGTQGKSGTRSVNELMLSYLAFAKTYYLKNGRPTSEVRNLKDAMRPLSVTHGGVAVTDFGPLALKAVRQSMIDSGLCRGVVNQRINRIRRVFKWGVENQIVPSTVLLGLQAVAPLKRGRCEVREKDPVTPVPGPYVDAVVQIAPPHFAAMIELQRLTGMRPGEVVLMRTADIDTTGPIWVFTPTEHKTQHHGRKRVIHLGPQAQTVLRPFLKKDLNAFIFCPRDVLTLRSIELRQARQTPMTPSQAARRPKKNPKRSPGDRYTTVSYCRAIARLCDLAFPPPLPPGTVFSKLSKEQRADVAKWRREHRWSPNRLRHNAATYLRKQFGIEAARVVLGHSSAGVTEIYAEQDLSKAADIMGRVG